MNKLEEIFEKYSFDLAPEWDTEIYNRRLEVFKQAVAEIQALSENDKLKIEFVDLFLSNSKYLDITMKIDINDREINYFELLNIFTALIHQIKELERK